MFFRFISVGHISCVILTSYRSYQCSFRTPLISLSRRQALSSCFLFIPVTISDYISQRRFNLFFLYFEFHNATLKWHADQTIVIFDLMKKQVSKKTMAMASKSGGVSDSHSSSSSSSNGGVSTNGSGGISGATKGNKHLIWKYTSKLNPWTGILLWLSFFTQLNRLLLLGDFRDLVCSCPPAYCQKICMSLKI